MVHHLECCIFPPEIICKILSYTSPHDVIRWRTVSKQFRDITYDRAVWSTLYTNARLPRPLGPFPSQSTQFLERTLVASARLERTWTTQPIRDVARVDIRQIGQSVSPESGFIMVGGRWLLTCESSRKFILHDVDSETCFARVLLEHENAVLSWSACSLMSAGGWLLYILLCTSKHTLLDTELHEFRLDSATGELLGDTLLVLPSVICTRSLYLHHHSGPFVFIARTSVLDTRTRTFYAFPKFSSQSDTTPFEEPNSRSPLPWRVLSTNTHVIVVYDSVDGSSALVQVFILPDNPQPNSISLPTLYLTHEGIIPGDFVDFWLVQGPVIDPTTGSTNLRLVKVEGIRDVTSAVLVDLTLPKPSGVCLPIYIQMVDIFKLNGPTYHPSLVTYKVLLEASHDGHIRGLCVLSLNTHRFGHPQFKARNTTSKVLKFTIDITHDDYEVVLGEVVTPRWNYYDRNSFHMQMWFDGVRCRIWYQASSRPGEHFVVLDIE